MKYKTISIQLSGISPEAREQLQEIKEFCRQRGFEAFEVIDYNKRELLQICFEDKFYSEEMKRLIEECQENEWPEGEQICKNSRNILEAYSKAKKAFHERSETLEDKTKPEPKSPAYVALLQAGSFKNFLARRIVRRVMEEYSKTEKERQ